MWGGWWHKDTQLEINPGAGACTILVLESSSSFRPVPAVCYSFISLKVIAFIIPACWGHSIRFLILSELRCSTKRPSFQYSRIQFKKKKKKAIFQFPLSHFRALQKLFNQHQQSVTETSAHWPFQARFLRKPALWKTPAFSKKKVQGPAALLPSSRGGVSKCKAAHLRLPVPFHLDCPLTLLRANEPFIIQIPEKKPALPGLFQCYSSSERSRSFLFPEPERIITSTDPVGVHHPLIYDESITKETHSCVNEENSHAQDLVSRLLFVFVLV